MVIMVIISGRKFEYDTRYWVLWRSSLAREGKLPKSTRREGGEKRAVRERRE